MSMTTLMIAASLAVASEPGYKDAAWGATLSATRSVLALGTEQTYSGKRGGNPTEEEMIDLPSETCLLKDVGARYSQVWRFFEYAKHTISGVVMWKSFGAGDTINARDLFFIDDKFRAIAMKIDPRSRNAVIRKLTSERGAPQSFTVTAKNPTNGETYATHCRIWKGADAAVILSWTHDETEDPELSYIDPNLRGEMRATLESSRKAERLQRKKDKKDVEKKDLEKL